MILRVIGSTVNRFYGKNSIRQSGTGKKGIDVTTEIRDKRDMRKFTAKYRLQTYSLPEIEYAFTAEAARLTDILLFLQRKVRPGHLLNAIALEFLDLSVAEREDLAARGLAKLELLVRKAEPNHKVTKGQSGPIVDVPVDFDSKNLTRRTRAPRKPKQGGRG
jgi:hypothetical protein